MKQIYKAGGVRKTESGIEYTIRAVGDVDRAILLSKGWVSSIDELKAKEVKSLFDLESSKAEKPETKKKVKGK